MVNNVNIDFNYSPIDYSLKWNNIIELKRIKT